MNHSAENPQSVLWMALVYYKLLVDLRDPC